MTKVYDTIIYRLDRVSVDLSYFIVKIDLHKGNWFLRTPMQMSRLVTFDKFYEHPGTAQM